MNNNKYNNPCSNTYNPYWRDHPNFSWSNNQNQLKSQALQVTSSFYAPNYVVANQENNQYIVANQENNQLKNILKSFIQESKNQFQAQGVSIMNLENQIG